MAHDIDQASKGTEAAFFSRKPAWHGLGTVIDEDVSTSEALVLARADYEVHEQLLPPVDTEHGLLDLAGQAKATYRLHPDTGKPQKLGLVGATYQVIQNRDAFGFLDLLLDPDATEEVADSTGAPVSFRSMNVETAGVLRNGRSTFVTAYLPDDIVIDPGGLDDAVRTYLAVLNSHDGSSGLRGLITPVRIVCANTEAVAIKTAQRSFSVQHRSKAHENLAEARRALGLTFRYQEAFEPLATNMARTEITDAQWTNIVERIYEPDAKSGQKAAQTRVEERRQQLDRLYRGPANESVAGTVWGAFNAYTEWLDHERPEQTEGNRATQITEGEYSKPKTAAWNKLIKTYKVPVTA